jgi:hypothetical protein
MQGLYLLNWNTNSNQNLVLDHRWVLDTKIDWPKTVIYNFDFEGSQSRQSLVAYRQVQVSDCCQRVPNCWRHWSQISPSPCWNVCSNVKLAVRESLASKDVNMEPERATPFEAITRQVVKTQQIQKSSPNSIYSHAIMWQYINIYMFRNRDIQWLFALDTTRKTNSYILANN